MLNMIKIIIMIINIWDDSVLTKACLKIKSAKFIHIEELRIRNIDSCIDFMIYHNK